MPPGDRTSEKRKHEELADPKSGKIDKGPKTGKVFTLSKEGKKVCPYHQIGNCRYPGSCNFSNECYICGSNSHGANKCPALNSERAKTRLGL